MIAGIGLDVVEVARMERLLARSPGFAERYFTAAERTACMAARRPAERWASCFAVKEALLKAVGVGVLGSIELHEIEVVLGDRETVQVRAIGSARAAIGERRVWASVAVGGGQAWASVVLAG
ncbi:MAG: 4'-phosphopantetheinyl transferase superfamily protein [Deltaproteobacteria bacterium]|nr:4'-phosphopantetheinyl transferase superfamily protein [Nannocystaceae bacterium]